MNNRHLNSTDQTLSTEVLFLALYGRMFLSPDQELTSTRKLDNSRAHDAMKAIASASSFLCWY